MENQPKPLKTYRNQHGTMKNQSGAIKTNLELYRVVMGGSGGYRRLPGGSAHFSLQTELHHNIYIIIIIYMYMAMKNRILGKHERCLRMAMVKEKAAALLDEQEFATFRWISSLSSPSSA